MVKYCCGSKCCFGFFSSVDQCIIWWTTTTSRHNIVRPQDFMGWLKRSKFGLKNVTSVQKNVGLPCPIGLRIPPEFIMAIGLSLHELFPLCLAAWKLTIPSAIKFPENR